MMSMQDKLEEYVRERGIDMPVYTTGKKISEEAQEARDALEDWLRDPSEAHLQHLMEEVADLAIVAAVAAHQAGFTVEEALEVKINKDRGRGRKQ